MKKLHLLLCLVLPTGLMAQNLNFENWEESGSEPPFNWEQPEEWTSSNSLTEWTSAGVTKSEDAQDGTYALQMRSVNIGSGTPSVVCLGEPDLVADFENPSINIATGGIPYPIEDGNTIIVTGHYKFNNNLAVDSAYAVVLLKKYNTTLNKIDTVALGTKSLGQVSDYTEFQIDLDYTTTSTAADSLVIALFSSKPDAPHPPSIGADGLLIDNIMINNSLSTPENAQDLIQIYPNPASDYLVIQHQDLQEERLLLYNQQGSLIKEIPLQGEQTKLSLKAFSNGLYYLRNASQSISKSIVISH